MKVFLEIKESDRVPFLMELVKSPGYVKVMEEKRTSKRVALFKKSLKL